MPIKLYWNITGWLILQTHKGERTKQRKTKLERKKKKNVLSSNTRPAD